MARRLSRVECSPSDLRTLGIWGSVRLAWACERGGLASKLAFSRPLDFPCKGLSDSERASGARLRSSWVAPCGTARPPWGREWARARAKRLRPPSVSVLITFGTSRQLRRRPLEPANRREPARLSGILSRHAVALSPTQ